MGFFEIFLAVLGLLGGIVGVGVILTALAFGYFVLTDDIRVKYEKTMIVVDGVALFLLIASVLTAVVYFGQ